MALTASYSQKETFGKSPTGINIGDIVAEDEEFYGDDVIGATRLEGLAKQGLPVEK